MKSHHERSLSACQHVSLHHPKCGSMLCGFLVLSHTCFLVLWMTDLPEANAKTLSIFFYGWWMIVHVVFAFHWGSCFLLDYLLWHSRIKHCYWVIVLNALTMGSHVACLWWHISYKHACALSLWHTVAEDGKFTILLDRVKHVHGVDFIYWTT